MQRVTSPPYMFIKRKGDIMEKDLNKKSIIVDIMTKIQEYVSTILTFVGIYLILVYFTLFNFSPKLQSIVGPHSNLLLIGAFLLIISYLISPILWQKLYEKLKK